MSGNILYKIYGVSLLATLCLCSVYASLNHHLDGSIWQTMQQSKSALTIEYCELDQTSSFFRQTMNTYSNLMYFFLGLIVVLISFYDYKNRQEKDTNLIQQFPLLSFFFGCCLIYLCFGSSFFHASLTWKGQRIDMNATYSICIALIAVSYYRLFFKKAHAGLFQILFIGALFLFVFLFLKLHLIISSHILLPLLILLVIIATIINYAGNKKSFNLYLSILSLLLMIGAFILRTLDVKKIGCDPTSVFQGHALWHLFTGMGAFLLYWFYRTEKV